MCVNELFVVTGNAAGVVADAHVADVQRVPHAAPFHTRIDRRVGRGLVVREEAPGRCPIEQRGVGGLDDIGEMPPDAFFVQPAVEHGIARPAHGFHLHAVLLRERRAPVHHHVDFGGRIDRQRALLARSRDQRRVGRGIGCECRGNAKADQRAGAGPQKLSAAYDPVGRDSLRPGYRARFRAAGSRR